MPRGRCRRTFRVVVVLVVLHDRLLFKKHDRGQQKAYGCCSSRYSVDEKKNRSSWVKAYYVQRYGTEGVNNSFVRELLNDGREYRRQTGLSPDVFEELVKNIRAALRWYIYVMGTMCLHFSGENS